MDEIVVPLVQSRAKNAELIVDEENGYAKMLKWNKEEEEEEEGTREEEEEEGRIITKFVQGLEVLLQRHIYEAVVRAR